MCSFRVNLATQINLLMLNKLYLLLISLAILNISFAQQTTKEILQRTLSLRGLTEEDITIPLDFFNVGEKSPVGSSKLILPIVKQILISPLQSQRFLDSLKTDYFFGLMGIINTMYSFLNISTSYFTSHVACPREPDEILYSLNLTCIGMINQQSVILQMFSKNEIAFLKKNLMSIIEETNENDLNNLYIFDFNKKRDSSIKTAKTTIDVLSKFDVQESYDYIIEEFEYIFQLSCYYYQFKNEYIKSWGSSYSKSEIECNGRKIAVGGANNDIYNGDYAFIIDFGGNDVYNIERKNLIGNNFNCIIDLSGSDHYKTNSDFALAGGLFSSSFIFDKEGDDVYECKNGGLGAAIGGLGLLYDENGNDTYRALSFSMGAGCFGVGLLIDRNGNDVYIANSYSQGFGLTQGVGAIIDNKGNDSYLVDSRSLDIGRYNDHYLSMCQGFGLGLRPYYAGGIGLIIEGEGNDVYSTDIYGQGSAYWYSLGAIIDKSGHDKYNSYQYAQGSGIHIAVGLLKDYDGWDFYTSNGVSQGCGHDYGFGFLWDVKGNDNYSAYGLSQGAGNANGIGLLLDESGRDGYLNKEPGNTRGYGNPRREFGSLGLCIDASGTDFYSTPGFDSSLTISSSWGIFTDYPFIDVAEQISGDNFKVEVDSINRPLDPLFTTEEYFIMAKTIEPRFSKWQDFGFRNLISDSINTAYYIMTLMGTDDHRIVQAMRVLITKIPYSISLAIIEKLKKDMYYLKPEELSMICYLAGETKNPCLKDALLGLTFDQNIRVRSTAINALGKLQIDSSDSEFISKVSARLTQLVNEGSGYKLMNKDVAFTFKNYKQETNIPALMKLMSNDYFGARFMAADALRNYGDIYHKYINNDFVIEVTQDKIILHSFLNSLSGLSDQNFTEIINTLTEERYDVIESLTFAEVIKARQSTTKDNAVKFWCSEKVKMLLEGNPLKIK